MRARTTRPPRGIGGPVAYVRDPNSPSYDPAAHWGETDEKILFLLSDEVNHLVDEWERRFLLDIYGRSPLTRAQHIKVSRIYDKYHKPLWWSTCLDPERMLQCLKGKASTRKFRLFAVGCCQRIRHLLIDPRLHQALEAAVLFADDLLTFEVYQARLKEIFEALHADRESVRLAAWAADLAVGGRCAITPNVLLYWIDQALAAEVQERCDALEVSERAERTKQEQTCVFGENRQAASDLLREIFGNPFRPGTLEPAWLTWHDGTVPKLAQSIYERTDSVSLPILADALEEAGCSEATILEHCRQPQEHVKGCWVLDRILGKT
jgi:hypothetical protein